MPSWMNKNWPYVVIGLLLLGYSLYHPLLRQVVLFVLPLGRGFDDTVAWGAIVLAIVFFVFGKFRKDLP